MPIAAIRTRRISAALHTPFVTALRRTTTTDFLLVEVIDSDGRTGFGEAPQVWAVTGANIAGSQAAVEEMIAPRLIGRDPDDLNANCALVAKAVVGNEAAKMAVDVALHDLAARRLGITLPRLLGGPNATPHTLTTPSASAGTISGRIRRARRLRDMAPILPTDHARFHCGPVTVGCRTGGIDWLTDEVSPGSPLRWPQ